MIAFVDRDNLMVATSHRFKSTLGFRFSTSYDSLGLQPCVRTVECPGAQTQPITVYLIGIRLIFPRLSIFVIHRLLLARTICLRIPVIWPLFRFGVVLRSVFFARSLVGLVSSPRRRLGLPGSIRRGLACPTAPFVRSELTYRRARARDHRRITCRRFGAVAPALPASFPAVRSTNRQGVGPSSPSVSLPLGSTRLPRLLERITEGGSLPFRLDRRSPFRPEETTLETRARSPAPTSSISCDEDLDIKPKEWGNDGGKDLDEWKRRSIPSESTRGDESNATQQVREKNVRHGRDARRRSQRRQRMCQLRRDAGLGPLQPLPQRVLLLAKVPESILAVPQGVLQKERLRRHDRTRRTQVCEVHPKARESGRTQRRRGRTDRKGRQSHLRVQPR